MSNIKVLYPAGYLATEITTSQTLNSLYDAYDYSRGRRAVIPQLSANQTTLNIIYDFGTSTTIACDSLGIGRADLLQDQGSATISLDRSTNGSTWTTEHSVSSFSSYTLKGPTSRDVYDTFTLSTAYRYWRIALTGASGLFSHSHHFFCTAFDFGRDPETLDYKVLHNFDQPVSSAGSVDFFRVDSPQRKYIFQWKGVTDAKLQSAYNNFLRYNRDIPVCLVTETSTNILQDFEIVQCSIIDWTHRKLKADYYEITIEFLEELG